VEKPNDVSSVIEKCLVRRKVDHGAQDLKVVSIGDEKAAQEESKQFFRPIRKICRLVSSETKRKRSPR